MVATTAAATKADGAPRLQHHEYASSIKCSMSGAESTMFPELPPRSTATSPIPLFLSVRRDCSAVGNTLIVTHDR